MRREPGAGGYSLIELMVAVAITAATSAAVFNLFFQNRNLFEDQSLIVEMRQTARAVASMMAGEIRMAGQGIPVHAGSTDAAAGVEAVQAFLDGTDESTIVFRAGVRNGRAVFGSAPPPALALNRPATLTVADAGAVSSIVGRNSGRFVFLWGETAAGWTWVRAHVDAIDGRADTLTITPRQMAPVGGRFRARPDIQAEEATGYRLRSGSVQRAESRDFTSPEAPRWVWSALGDHFTELAFVYRDASGNAVSGDSVEARARIRRVDFRIRARTARRLIATGEFGTFDLAMTVYPRNVQLY